MATTLVLLAACLPGVGAAARASDRPPYAPELLAQEGPWLPDEATRAEAPPPQPFQRRSRERGQGAFATGAAAGGSWVRTTAALAGVVALIVLLGWGYRVVGGGRIKLGQRGRSSVLIEIVGRTALSPRQSLCLVRIGPRLLLLGVSQEGIRSLDVIQDHALVAQLLGEAARRKDDSSTAEFARCLEREARALADDPPPQGALDAAVPDELRVREIREQLDKARTRLRSIAAQA